MRIESGKQIEHLGAVRIHDVRRLLELDSGARIPTLLQDGTYAQKIERDTIAAIQQKMAIVLPIKDEDVKIFEGVLSGVPHDCVMVIISNSQRDEIDNFKNEQDILSRFCDTTKRSALMIHQKDPHLGEALAHCGYNELLDDKGLVRSGKSEGMIIGILLALLLGKEYVGFIDTDNYVPGAVWEYAQHYAIGFSLSESPYSIVRILWRYKPKLSGQLHFKKWGRVSEITNKHINHFLSTKGRFETNIIKTANAGEHAMSLRLATKLTYATGYGVETQELMSILEQFGGLLPKVDPTVVERGVDIIQTETINPHLHEERGEDHLVQDMLVPSLSVIYHNRLCEDTTKEMIQKQLVELDCLSPEAKVPQLRMIPPIDSINVQKFAGILHEHINDYSVPTGWSVWAKLPVLDRKVAKVQEVMKLVFTDLDGTLLHPVSYSYAAALDSVRRLQKERVPIIFCSAKTESEQQVYRKELKIQDPFIVENGAAIFVPKDYFRFPFNFSRVTDDYFVIELGISYEEVREKLKSISGAFEARITCFGDLSIEEVAKVSGLNLLMAELAKQRQYSETLILEGNQKQIKSALDAIAASGLSYTFGGKFYEVFQGGDKGKAVKILIELFKLNFGSVFTIGIGDSLNDVGMLDAVDLPMQVQMEGNRWHGLKVKKLKCIKGVGPEGWSLAVSELFNQKEPASKENAAK